MVLLTFNPNLARLIISPREDRSERRSAVLESLEEAIQQGKWESIAPIWLTPNYLINGIFRGLYAAGIISPTFKPFIIYNGHNRFEKAIEHGLPLRAYVRYTFGNPKMPKEEKLLSSELGRFGF